MVVLVLGGAGIYLLTQNQSKPGPAEPMLDQTQEQEESQIVDTEDVGDKENYTGTLKKMVGLGVPLKCTFNQGDEYSGTTWVKGKKFYSEIESQEKAGKVIFKDDCMWNWSEGEEEGIKMCFEPEEAEDMFSGETDTGQTNLPTDVNFNCQPAVFTDAKFDPPSGIEFMDMDEMMQEFSQ